MEFVNAVGRVILVPFHGLAVVSGLPLWVFLLGWMLFFSLADFALMGVDKWKAKKGAWRVPERTLWLFAALGGALGGIAGMQTFRHKTLHTVFRIGMPILGVLQIVILFWLLLL